MKLLWPLLMLLVCIPACKNACEKYQEHVLDCHAQFCSSYPQNPICSAEERAAAEREMSCDDVHERVSEQLVERDCSQLARQLGWEALNSLPR